MNCDVCNDKPAVHTIVIGYQPNETVMCTECIEDSKVLSVLSLCNWLYVKGEYDNVP